MLQLQRLSVSVSLPVSPHFEMQIPAAMMLMLTVRTTSMARTMVACEAVESNCDDDARSSDAIRGVGVFVFVTEGEAT